MSPKGGRPPHQPTDKQRGEVSAYARVGYPYEQIARFMGIAVETLRKHYIDELETSKGKAGAQVLNNLYRQATKDDFRAIPAAQFIARTQYGWNEKNELALTGPGGGPVMIGRIVREIIDPTNPNSESISPAPKA